jgi:hypothetical protein
MFRKFALAAFTLSLGVTGLSACSSDSSDTTSAAVETAPAAETAATVETVAEVAETTAAAAAETTAAPAAETTAAVAAETVAAAAGGAATDALTYTLKEWTLEGSATLPAGQTEISVNNGGNFAHEFLVIKGTTYEEAAKNDLGTVLEDQLPAGAVLGEIEKIEKGASAKLSVDLTPGTYLFVCNIEFGPNSHAGKGQRLNVTVA